MLQRLLFLPFPFTADFDACLPADFFFGLSSSELSDPPALFTSARFWSAVGRKMRTCMS